MRVLYVKAASSCQPEIAIATTFYVQPQSLKAANGSHRNPRLMPCEVENISPVMKTNKPARKTANKQRPRNEDLIYGVHAVEAALANPRRRLIELLHTDNAARHAFVESPSRDVKTRQVSSAELSRLLPADAVHQGLLLRAHHLDEPSLSEIADDGIVVVLDQITDPHNVGAILRSCAAYNVVAVVTTERNSPPPTGVLAKAASGALEFVPYIRTGNLARAMTELAKRGRFLVGLDSDAPDLIGQGHLDGNVALVFGAEGRGLRRLTRETCDAFVRLDVPGPIRSLNVSNAVAICLATLHHARSANSPQAK